MKITVERGPSPRPHAVTKRESDGLSVPPGAPGAHLAARMGAYPAHGRISMTEIGGGHALQCHLSLSRNRPAYGDSVAGDPTEGPGAGAPGPSLSFVFHPPDNLLVHEWRFNPLENLIDTVKQILRTMLKVSAVASFKVFVFTSMCCRLQRVKLSRRRKGVGSHHPGIQHVPDSGAPAGDRAALKSIWRIRRWTRLRLTVWPRSSNSSRIRRLP